MAAAVDLHGCSSIAGAVLALILARRSRIVSPVRASGWRKAMTEEGLRAGTERIVAARAAVAKLDGLPDAERPRTIEDGYQMLRIATERWSDEPSAGRSAPPPGRCRRCSASASRSMAPCSRPPCMRAPRAWRLPPFSTCCWRPSSLLVPRRAAPRAKPYAREEVLEAIETVIPSIEVISPRFKRLSVDHTPQFIADFSGNAARRAGHALPGLARARPCRAGGGDDHRRRHAAGGHRRGDAGQPAQRARMAGCRHGHARPGHRARATSS